MKGVIPKFSLRGEETSYEMDTSKTTFIERRNDS